VSARRVQSGRNGSGDDVHPSGRLGLLFSLIGVKLRSEESVVVWAEERVGMADRGLRGIGEMVVGVRERRGGVDGRDG
jgi:hypothetical protein